MNANRKQMQWEMLTTRKSNTGEYVQRFIKNTYFV